MSDILKQIDTYELIEYWKYEAYKSELKFKSVINERNKLIERFLEEKTNQKTRIKELESAYAILDDCYKDQEKTIKELESALREFIKDTDFFVDIDWSTTSEEWVFAVADKLTAHNKKARKIITKHKDLIESINKG